MMRKSQVTEGSEVLPLNNSILSSPLGCRLKTQFENIRYMLCGMFVANTIQKPVGDYYYVTMRQNKN